jgi:hypothetical protein
MVGRGTYRRSAASLIEWKDGATVCFGSSALTRIPKAKQAVPKPVSQETKETPMKIITNLLLDILVSLLSNDPKVGT